MTFAAYRRHSLLAATALAVVLTGAVAAAADCASELTASQQNLERTRAMVSATATGSEAQKCAAQRRYYAALVKVREVFSRCDTGGQKSDHAAQLKVAIDDFRGKMPQGCRP
jgi:hypothetical protein